MHAAHLIEAHRQKQVNHFVGPLGPYQLRSGRRNLELGPAFGYPNIPGAGSASLFGFEQGLPRRYGVLDGVLRLAPFRRLACAPRWPVGPVTPRFRWQRSRPPSHCGRFRSTWFRSPKKRGSFHWPPPRGGHGWYCTYVLYLSQHFEIKFLSYDMAAADCPAARSMAADPPVQPGGV